MTHPAPRNRPLSAEFLGRDWSHTAGPAPRLTAPAGDATTRTAMAHAGTDGFKPVARHSKLSCSPAARSFGRPLARVAAAMPDDPGTFCRRARRSSQPGRSPNSLPSPLDMERGTACEVGLHPAHGEDDCLEASATLAIRSAQLRPRPQPAGSLPESARPGVAYSQGQRTPSEESSTLGRKQAGPGAVGLRVRSRRPSGRATLGETEAARKKARGLGFEPRQTEPKSVVLPLHYPRMPSL